MGNTVAMNSCAILIQADPEARTLIKYNYS